MRRTAIALLPLLLAPSVALAGNPWEELMGPGKPHLWNDPEARFYLDLPVGWNAEVRKTPGHTVDFVKVHPDNGFTAHVTVEMRSLPPGVKTGHFAMRVQEETKKQAPGYKLIETDKIELSGVPAHRSYFTFRELHNAALTDESVQIVLVVGERGFVITLVCALGAKDVFWEDFQKMMKNFVARGAGEEPATMPKERKRIRAGEMVNPDAVQY